MVVIDDNINDKGQMTSGNIEGTSMDLTNKTKLGDMG